MVLTKLHSLYRWEGEGGIKKKFNYSCVYKNYVFMYTAFFW